jgi:hypothetical protein
VCKLRIDDVDPKRMVLRIRNSKRGRERYVMLSVFSRRCARTGNAHDRGVTFRTKDGRAITAAGVTFLAALRPARAAAALREDSALRPARVRHDASRARQRANRKSKRGSERGASAEGLRITRLYANFRPADQNDPARRLGARSASAAALGVGMLPDPASAGFSW